MTTKKILTYSELIQIPTFEERLKYLSLHGKVGEDTFGFDRFVNQQFYRSKEWKSIRNRIIERDGCCDLGISDHVIFERPIIHHMNPLSYDDISDMSDYVTNPEYLITTTHLTHLAIHYSDSSLLPTMPAERKPNDTCPWRNSRG